jgi:hypothetical protein
MREKVGLKQFLIYRRPFPPLSPIFYLPLFNSVSEKSIPRHKKYWKDICPPHAPSGYACAYHTPNSAFYHSSTLHMDVPGSSYNLEVKIQIS